MDGAAAEAAAKARLQEYLRQARTAVLGKLDGLSEYEVRRPRTPTGTNLLGLVKHLVGVEIGYFGDTFGRPFPEPPPWLLGDTACTADPNIDMCADGRRDRRAHIVEPCTGAARARTPIATIDGARRSTPRRRGAAVARLSGRR